jgi:1-acyl-sn-glycerol-3-phosphate acyltransferase
MMGLSVYFEEISIHGKKHIPKKGPLLLVANHPNALMDPVVVSTILRQRIGFLAKASLFSSPIHSWFLSNVLHVIPVQRREDAAEGEMINNVKSFQKTFDYLTNNGTILIFPEGTSILEMKLRKLKTGIARIALGFEELNAFNAKLKIMVMAINYSEAHRFRSKVTINISKPFSVEVYKELYKTDQVLAVQMLTKQIRKKLEKKLVLAADKEQEHFLRQVTRIYRDYLIGTLQLKRNSETEFALLKRLGNAITYTNLQNPQAYTSIKQQTDNYLELLKKHKLHDEVFRHNPEGMKFFLSLLVRLLYLIILAPLCIFGILANALPFVLPSKLFPLISREIEYKAAIVMTLGLILFPVFYLLETFLLHSLISTDLWQTILFAFMLPISGLLVLHYAKVLKVFRGLVKVRKMRTVESGVVAELKSMKENLIADLEKMRIDFISS